MVLSIRLRRRRPLFIIIYSFDLLNPIQSNPTQVPNRSRIQKIPIHTEHRDGEKRARMGDLLNSCYNPPTASMECWISVADSGQVRRVRVWQKQRPFQPWCGSDWGLLWPGLPRQQRRLASSQANPLLLCPSRFSLRSSLPFTVSSRTPIQKIRSSLTSYLFPGCLISAIGHLILWLLMIPVSILWVLMIPVSRAAIGNFRDSEIRVFLIDCNPIQLMLFIDLPIKLII